MYNWVFLIKTEWLVCKTKLWEEENNKHLNENLYAVPLILVWYWKTASLTQHQSAARNRVEIGCILSKDCNLSSAVCACNSCHILQGPGVKQADLNYMNEPSVTLRPQKDKEERSLAASNRLWMTPVRWKRNSDC